MKILFSNLEFDAYVFFIRSKNIHISDDKQQRCLMMKSEMD